MRISMNIYLTMVLLRSITRLHLMNDMIISDNGRNFCCNGGPLHLEEHSVKPHWFPDKKLVPVMQKHLIRKRLHWGRKYQG